MPPDGPVTVAFEVDELLDQLEDQIGAVFYRYRIPPQDAEDLLQDSVVALVTKAATIKMPAAWLMTTLRFLCVSYWRARRRWVFEELDAALLPQGGDSRSADDQAWRHDLHAALSRLPSRCRAILHQRYGLGCTAAEVATRLGYREATVRQITLRCLSALTRQLIPPGPKVPGP